MEYSVATYGQTVAGKPLVLNGTGFGLTEAGGQLQGTGALANLAAGLTWTGTITLATSSTISTTAGKITALGVIAGAGDLTAVGSSTLTLQAADTLTGNTIVTGGTLVLNMAGSIATTASITVNPAGTLTLDNTVVITGSNDEQMSSRLGTAPITLNGGTLNFNGSNTANTVTTETIGTITLNSGASTIQASNGTGSAAAAMLTAAGLVRKAGATVYFSASAAAASARALGSASNQIFFTSAPRADVGDHRHDRDLAVGDRERVPESQRLRHLQLHQRDHGLQRLRDLVDRRDLNVGREAVGERGADRQHDHRRPAGHGHADGDVERLHPVDRQRRRHGDRQRHHADHRRQHQRRHARLRRAEGLLDASFYAASSITVNSAISGTGGLTVAQNTAGTISLAAAAGNSYSGGTTLAGGTLSVANASALGNGTLTLIGGTLVNTFGSNFALGNPVVFNNSVVTIGNTTNGLSLAGPIALTGSNQITISTSTTKPVYFSGAVSGTGALSLNGGTLVLQNPNDIYSGGTNVGGGVLQVDSSDTFSGSAVLNGPLGTGPVNLKGGTFQSAARPPSNTTRHRLRCTTPST